MSGKVVLLGSLAALVSGCGQGPFFNAPGANSALQTLMSMNKAPRSLFIVAHEDDDILFMNPDVQNAIDVGHQVITVFVTAGDAGKGERYWLDREAGARAAYDAMLGNPNAWREHTIVLPSGETLTAYGDDERAVLVFLRLPDGNVLGNGFAADQNESLVHLWDGSLGEMHAVDGSWTATRDGLLNVLSTIMRVTTPVRVHFLDCTGAYGKDHSDHLHSAMFGMLAYQQSAAQTPFSMYRGYNISAEPNNLTAAQGAAKLAVFDDYLPHDTLQCPQAGCATPSNYVDWSQRQYPIPFTDPDAVTCMQ